MKAFTIILLFMIAVIVSNKALSSSGIESSHCDLDSSEEQRVVGCTLVIANSDSKEERSLAYAYRASSYASWRQYDRALEDIENAMLNYPDNAFAYVIRGHIYSRIDDDYERARADMDKAVSLSPNDAEVRLYRAGMHFFRLEDIDKGIEDYNEAISLQPRQHKYYWRFASALGRIDEWDSALRYYTKAIELDPYMSEAYYRRAQAYRWAGDYQTAIEDYNEAIKLEPENSEAYAGRGDAHRASGSFEKSLEDYGIAITLDPYNAAHHYQRSRLHMESGDVESQLSDLDRAVALDPLDVWYYRARIRVNSELERWDKVLSDYNRRREIEPDNALNFVGLARVFRQLGDLAESKSYYDEGIALLPDNPLLYVYRSMIYRRMGDMEKARHDLDEAIRIDPSYGRAYKARADLNKREERYADEVLDYDRLIDIDPSLDNYLSRSSAHRRDDNLKMALSDLYFSIRMAPASPLPYSYMSRLKLRPLRQDGNLSSMYRSIGEATRELRDDGVDLIERNYGLWGEVPQDKISDLYQELRNLLQERQHPVRDFVYAHQVELPFYDNVKLINVGAELPAGQTGFYSVLLSEGEITLLDGQSQTIYDFNMKYNLSLDDPGQAASYLRFFAGFIVGSTGEPFTIVESVTDIPWSHTINKEYIVSTDQFIPPLSVEVEEDKEGWLIQAGFSYRNDFSQGNFLVERNGVVSMLSDRTLTNPLLVGRVSVENGLWLTDHTYEW